MSQSVCVCVCVCVHVRLHMLKWEVDSCDTNDPEEVTGQGGGLSFRVHCDLLLRHRSKCGWIFFNKWIRNLQTYWK